MFQLSYITKEGVHRKVSFISHSFARETAKAEVAAGSTKVCIKPIRRNICSYNPETQEVDLMIQNVMLSQAANAVRDFLTEEEQLGILLLPPDAQIPKKLQLG